MRLAGIYASRFEFWGLLGLIYTAYSDESRLQSPRHARIVQIAAILSRIAINVLAAWPFALIMREPDYAFHSFSKTATISFLGCSSGTYDSGGEFILGRLAGAS